MKIKEGREDVIGNQSMKEGNIYIYTHTHMNREKELIVMIFFLFNFVFEVYGLTHSNN